MGVGLAPNEVTEERLHLVVLYSLADQSLGINDYLKARLCRPYSLAKNRLIMWLVCLRFAVALRV